MLDARYCAETGICYNRRMNAPLLDKTSASPIRALKVIKIGNSHGVILPREVLDKLGVGLGDALDIVNDAEGGLQLRRHDHGFASQMEAARAVMKRRRDALRELAK